MSEGPQKRRWFQISLRTMLLLVALLAVFFARQANWIRHRRQFRDEQEFLREQESTHRYWEIQVSSSNPPDESSISKLTRWVFREPKYIKPSFIVMLDEPDSAENLAAAHRDKIESAKSLFPEGGSVTAIFLYPKVPWRQQTSPEG